MLKRDPSRGRPHRRLSGLRQRIRGACLSNPLAVALGMLGLLAVAVTGLLLARHPGQRSYAASAGELYRQLALPGHKAPAPRSGAADVLELVRLYSDARRLDPDSLGGRDSAFLKAIDQRLNRILYEAP